VNWPQGRPLNHFMPPIFGYIGNLLGGLDALYLLASIWLGFNSWLIFILSNKWLGVMPSIVAAMSYILFPSDEIRQLLHAAAHVQGAMTFSLLGLIVWMRRSNIRYLSYPVATLCLLSYELTFLPFLVAPLFGRGIDKNNEKKIWIEHLLICGAIITTIGIIRMRLGDTRAISAVAAPSVMFQRALYSTVIGPITDIKAYYTAFQYAKFSISSISVIVSTMLILCLYFISKINDNCSNNRLIKISNKRLFFASIIAWSSSYALTLVNYPPIQIIGRMSSTHVAAALPFSIFMGFCYSILTSKGNILKQITIICYCITFIILISYSIFIQIGFSNSTNVQKKFWQNILALAPDTEINTSIIVAGTPEPENTPHVILANSWADFYACRALFNQSSDLDDLKSVKFGHLGINPELWDFKIIGSEIVMWRPKFWTQDYEEIIPSKLILISSQKGELTRVDTLTFSVINSLGQKVNLTLHSTRKIPPKLKDIKAPSILFQTLWSRSL